jgi:hypothetical protein
MDISLANTIAKLAYHIILYAENSPWPSVVHMANLLMPLTADELKESAKAEGLPEDGSKVDIALRLTEHFHKYKFMPRPDELSKETFWAQDTCRRGTGKPIDDYERTREGKVRGQSPVTGKFCVWGTSRRQGRLP